MEGKWDKDKEVRMISEWPTSCLLNCECSHITLEPLISQDATAFGDGALTEMNQLEQAWQVDPDLI